MSFGWRIESEDGLAVMRFYQLESRGCRHGLVVKAQGSDIDEELVYRTLSARKPTVVTEQAHSTAVAEVGREFSDFWPAKVRADGLMTDHPGVFLTIHTADCVPVFLAGPGASALVHAGWRGTAEKIAERAVGDFCGRYGLGPHQLSAVIGPGIEQLCYPVDEKVASRFPDRSKKAAGGGKWMVDLKRENQLQLEKAGILRAHIYVSDLCTKCRQDLFHSYRREGDPLRGEMVAFIEAGNGQS